MGEVFFLSTGFVIVVINTVTSGSAAESCPSPPFVYASEGDNVTLCWSIVPEANTTFVESFKVKALNRPLDVEMKPVASAKKDGTPFRTFENHKKIYVGRATVQADLALKIVYLRIKNYTSAMENIYCVLYEMDGFNNVRTCHSHAVFLRDMGTAYTTERTRSTFTMTTKGETRANANTTTMTSTAASTTGKEPATQKRAFAETNYRVAVIIMGCVLGAVTFLAIFVFVLYCRIKQKFPTPTPSDRCDHEMKQQKRLLSNSSVVE